MELLINYLLYKNLNQVVSHHSPIDAIERMPYILLSSFGIGVYQVADIFNSTVILHDDWRHSINLLRFWRKQKHAVDVGETGHFIHN